MVENATSSTRSPWYHQLFRITRAASMLRWCFVCEPNQLITALQAFPLVPTETRFVVRASSPGRLVGPQHYRAVRAYRELLCLAPAWCDKDSLKVACNALTSWL